MLASLAKLGGGRSLAVKSCMTLVTSWTVICQAPLSIGFPRQEYGSRLPHPSPGDLPDPGMEPRSPAFQVDSLPTEPLGKFLNWVSKNFGINLEKEYTDVSKAFYAPQIWSLLDNSGHSAASPGGSALKGISCMSLGGNYGSPLIGCQ